MGTHLSSLKSNLQIIKWHKKHSTVTQSSKKGTKSSEGTNLIDSCESLNLGENQKVSITAPDDVTLVLWLCQASVSERMPKHDTAAGTSSDSENFWFTTSTSSTA